MTEQEREILAMLVDIRVLCERIESKGVVYVDPRDELHRLALNYRMAQIPAEVVAAWEALERYVLHGVRP